MHDSSKILMGTTQSSDRAVDSKAGSIEAGLIVRQKSDDTISVAAADGEALGISLGKDLSDTTRTAVCRRGLKVPVKLEDSFEPTLGAQVFINDTTGLAGAEDTGYTGVNAVYASTRKTAMYEDGTEAANKAALIDFPGGL